MKPARRLAISGIGLRSAAGLGAPAASAAVLAGIAAFQPSRCYQPQLHSPTAFPELLVVADALGESFNGVWVERLFALAGPALLEAAADAALTPSEIAGAGLYLVLSDQPDAAPDTLLARTFGERLVQRILPAPVSLIRTIPEGAAGLLSALSALEEDMAAGRAERGIVLAVDSWLDATRLRRLDDARRLKSASNPDGFIPGEGAAALVVAPAHAARRSRAQLGSIEQTEEPHPLGSKEVCNGRALARVLAPAVAAVSASAPVLCDFNGESFRAREWAYACVHLARAQRNIAALVHPADVWGDLGAASGAALVAVAAWQFSEARLPWPDAVVWCASDHGLRGACALSAGGWHAG